MPTTIVEAVVMLVTAGVLAIPLKSVSLSFTSN